VLWVLDRYLPGRMWLREAAVLDTPVTAAIDLADPATALAQLCAAHGLRVQQWPGLFVIGAP
jgi:ferric-dicitrate binding protein FerR (iron transport regulator)